MNSSKSIAAALAISLCSLAASAQTSAEHEQHHPDGAVPATAPSAPVTAEQQMSTMDQQLQRMRDMSRKLAQAKTPQERQALLAEHHKTMQAGMQLMGQQQAMPMTGMGMGMGMMGGASNMPSAKPGGNRELPDSGASPMGPQMMMGMMQRHAMMEKRMEMMQAMMQMMMDRMPADANRAQEVK